MQLWSHIEVLINLPPSLHHHSTTNHVRRRWRGKPRRRRGGGQRRRDKNNELPGSTNNAYNSGRANKFDREAFNPIPTATANASANDF